MVLFMVSLTHCFIFIVFMFHIFQSYIKKERYKALICIGAHTCMWPQNYIILMTNRSLLEG